MAKIAFIGLGNMGGPMARNLVKAGHSLAVFDLSTAAVEALVAEGASAAASPSEAARGAEVVVSMLPAGAHVKSVYAAEGGVIDSIAKGSLLIDCSTIDVASAREVSAVAEKAGIDMVDAPVSGGVGGAAAGTLTFMVGGSDAAFERAKPILDAMGKTIVHAGGPGNGQAAKICNNMLLGISMIGTCEAFALAEKLGLDAQKLFDISSKSSGQCWSMTSYCPVPGPVPASPANRDYQPGFATAMMLKDLKLAQEAAAKVGAATPLGNQAASLYTLFDAAGKGGVDFSGIINLLRGRI
ncbi:3-hydroxyisobutyrate dehydrogenase [Zavarzinia compransoris]|uniref:3-hydroxyisobutyrate dehydrogenase n=1 Tax=Zavarzinia compransoris TaxID=1264899 RepID=A0A317EB85_9PROT|nr:3-hydroxyisobutyrate dehydrogenase [Zavarzinia compransoris]PWR23410.1 3-hydroxyisobutyrate dehydrogenase [Zavarzinia compransoris]TDP46014.1 3-hydroxyisobutyrate dehydrogenase [Zavarzinia compransoris]